VRLAAALGQALVVTALAAPAALSAPPPHDPASAGRLTERALRTAADARPRPRPAPRCRLVEARGDRNTRTTDPTNRKAMQAVIRCFVDTAVTRRAPAHGYDISTRRERAGLTRRQWATGNIPVPMVPSLGRVGFEPGPARQTRLAHEYIVSVGKVAMLVDLVRSSRTAPWRIDYFQPFPFTVVPAP